MDEKTMQEFQFWIRDPGDSGFWMIESRCMVPSCRIKNMETGEILDFGIGGLTAGGFQPIEMDKALEDKLVDLFSRGRYEVVSPKGKGAKG